MIPPEQRKPASPVPRYPWLARCVSRRSGLVLSGMRALAHPSSVWRRSLVLWLLLATGCANLRLPAIDPSGERIFLPAPTYSQLAENAGPMGGLPDPAFAAPPPPPPCPVPSLGGGDSYLPPVGAQVPMMVVPGTPPPSPAEPPEPPEAPRLIDRWREHLSGRGEFDARLTLTPTRLVAPVGSEVVLRAGLCDAEGYLIMKQPIEWSLNGDSAGAIVSVDQFGKSSRSARNDREPRKESGTYAVGRTSTSALWVDRGTPSPNDDFQLPRGQTWISISSPTEGASHVTAVAPTASSWAERRRSATIHWIDGQWSFPSPSFGVPASGHEITTVVTRATSNGPIKDWLVRYEIVDGPPATLGNSGSQVAEVRTDGGGRATVRIQPTQGAAGTNRIRIQVIRTADAAGDLPRLVVGEGATSVTWSASGLTARITGPAIAELNALATYSIEVANPGDLPATGIEISNLLPSGLSYVRSDPAGEVFGNRIRWLIDNLGPRQAVRITAEYRIERQGVIRNCITARTATDLQVEDCAETNVTVPTLSVEMDGPQRARVGEQVRYRVRVSNQGAQPVDNVVVVDRFDPGLQHVEAASPIERPLGRLEPGQTREFAVTFYVVQPGTHCHTVEALSAQGLQGTARSCLTAEGGLASPVLPPPIATPPTGPAPAPPGLSAPAPPGLSAPAPPGLSAPALPGLSAPALPGVSPPGASPSGVSTLRVEKRVRIGGNEVTSARVGDVVEFSIRVTNNGTAPMTNVRIEDRFDQSLDPTVAGPKGFERSGNQLTWVVPVLNPGQFTTVQVNCRCVAPQSRACNTAIVSADQVPAESDDVCVAIVGPPLSGGAADGNSAPGISAPGLEGPAGPIGRSGEASDVQVSISQPTGPSVTVGAKQTYIVEIKNAGSTWDDNVILQIVLPDGLAFASAMTPPGVGTESSSPDRRSVQFLPIHTLRPGESVAFQIVADAMDPGSGFVRAEVTSDRLVRPVIESQETTVGQ